MEENKTNGEEKAPHMTKEEFMKAVKAYQEYLDTHPEELEKDIEEEFGVIASDFD